MQGITVIGHRGALGLAPENTLVSFKKALDCQVDAVEFDLRVTKDKVVVAHHDAAIADSSRRKHKISASSYSQLKKVKPDLATFQEVLDLLRGKLSIWIEVKPGVEVGPIVEILKQELGKNWPENKVVLGSKSQKTLMQLHRAFPDIRKVVIENWSGMRAVLRARQVKTNLLFMKQSFLWSGFISSMHKRGYKLYPWAMNDPAKAIAWKRYGIAGVITNFPDRFQKPEKS